jgi:hypothetical protein
MTVNTGIDHTNRMLRWANEKLSELERMDLCASCPEQVTQFGHAWRKLYTPEGVLKGAASVFRQSHETIPYPGRR